MIVYVENVKIELTPEQIKLVENDRIKRAKCISSFSSILKHFGFTKCKEVENGFMHTYHDWWAEILDHGNFRTVWIVGTGLKSISSIPGGWNYESPKEIETEIIRYNESLN